jgi:nitroreductase
MDTSEFLRFLQTRSSVRDYTAVALEEEQSHFILQCAQTAPSAGNRQAWDVVIVASQELREEIADLAYQQQHLAQASAVFVVCANYIRSMSQYGERGILYAVQDATIATTFMMLAAHALGLHTCWTGAFDEEGVKTVLALPQHIRPIALLAVGRGHLPRFRTERMPIADHVHYETW